MSVQIEMLEKNMAKLTIDVPAEEFEKQLQELIIKIKARSQFRASVKAMCRRRWLRRCTASAYFMKMLPTM